MMIALIFTIAGTLLTFFIILLLGIRKQIKIKKEIEREKRINNLFKLFLPILKK